MTQFVSLVIRFDGTKNARFKAEVFSTTFTWDSGSLDEHVDAFKRTCIAQMLENLSKANPVEGGRALPLDGGLGDRLEADAELGFYVADLKVFDNELPDPPDKPSIAESALAEMRAIQEQIVELTRQKDETTTSSYHATEFDRTISVLNSALARLGEKTADSTR